MSATTLPRRLRKMRRHESATFVWLDANGPATAGQVAEALGIASGTAEMRLRELQAARLVTRDGPEGAYVWRTSTVRASVAYQGIDDERAISAARRLRDYGIFNRQSLAAELGITDDDARRLVRRLASQGKLPPFSGGGPVASAEAEDAFNPTRDAAGRYFLPVGLVLVSAAKLRARLAIEADPTDPRRLARFKPLAPEPPPLDPLAEWQAGRNPLIGRFDTAVDIFPALSPTPKVKECSQDTATNS